MVIKLVSACALTAGLAHPARTKDVLKSASMVNAWMVNASATVDLWETTALFQVVQTTATTTVSATPHLELLCASVL